ncbi:MAG TPA: 2-C-methyl-D-erythritol 2,4-cyclodiphosphate synthase [Actinomycetota bacterium]|nr:2-C-methyl-D-erythritol 2,4-cyclodiphosphate synthase [Actinomycetota bacterium]
MSPARVGIGVDAHPFAEGRPLVLGGVVVPHEQGLAGHSDADVLVHAVIDALLGAAGLGDIGSHFPAGDERYRDADSLGLLAETARLVARAGFRVENVDSVVVAERPAIAPLRERMRERMAAALGIEDGRVSVKATTTDGMGFTGRGEGIAATAVALLFGD